MVANVDQLFIIVDQRLMKPDQIRPNNVPKSLNICSRSVSSAQDVLDTFRESAQDPAASVRLLSGAGVVLPRPELVPDAPTSSPHPIKASVCIRHDIDGLQGRMLRHDGPEVRRRQGHDRWEVCNVHTVAGNGRNL